MAEAGAYLAKQYPGAFGKGTAFPGVLKRWRSYASSEYGTRLPRDLKIAYLCGPNPRNDLDCLVNLGVRIQNVWAIEADRDTSTKALEEARRSFPELKIVPFKAHAFFEMAPVKFDVVYLDFTAPLFSLDKKHFEALHSLFDCQALSDLSVVVVNSCFPDEGQGIAEFLASFVAAMPSVPAALTEDACDRDNSFDRKFERYTDGAGPRADTPFEFCDQLAEAGIRDLYSAFSTGYPIAYAAAVQPFLRTLKQAALRHRIFAKGDVIAEELHRFNDIHTALSAMVGIPPREDRDRSGFRMLSPESAPLSWWLDLCQQQPEGLVGQRWCRMYEAKLPGNISRREAVEWGDLLRCAAEGYLDTLSEKLFLAIQNVARALPDRDVALFADSPTLPLWIETAVNQLGEPHHANVERHRRYAYRARKREMCLDIFVFDRCRPFYNWLPLPELYGDDLQRIERQMVARLCLDAIAKQSHELVPYALQWANVVPKSYGGAKHFDFAYLRRRVQIARSKKKDSKGAPG